jgi:hypothetical protein
MAAHMKCLTEFGGVTIRMAAAALADAKRLPPTDERPAAVADSAAGSEVTASPDASAETDAVNAALDAAVAKATGLSGDRLGMLRAAVGAAGNRTADVRTVRVFGPEEPVAGAKSIGGRQYLVDYLPQSMKQVTDSKKDERGRGGRGRGAGGARSSGAGRGAGAGATGGFSLDSLRDDRKSERGGGRRPAGPSGGRPKK